MLYETLITKTKEELDQEQVDNRVIQAQARISKAISTAIEECSLAKTQMNQAWFTNPLNVDKIIESKEYYEKVNTKLRFLESENQRMFSDDS